MDDLAKDAGAALMEIEPYVHDNPLMQGLSNLLARVVVAHGGKLPANNPAVAGGLLPPWVHGTPTLRQQGLLAQQAYMAGTLAAESNPAIEQMLKEKLAAQEKALQQAFNVPMTSGKGLFAGESLSGRSDAASLKQQKQQQDLADFYANTTPVSYSSTKRSSWKS